MDLYSLGAIANALALAVLCAARPFPARTAVLAGVWVLALLGGLWVLDGDVRGGYLRRFAGLKAAERVHVRAYLASGDPAALRSAPREELPYPNADDLARFLAAPAIRSLLPLGIRPALELAADSGSTGFEAAGPADLAPGTAGPGWVAHRGPARFVSRPLPGVLLPYLHVLAAGGPDLGPSALRLESDDPGRPSNAASRLGPRWDGADIEVPAGGSVRLVAEVPPGGHWLAFTQPVELGRDSLVDRWLLRRGASIAAAGGLLLLCALAVLLARDLGGAGPGSQEIR